MKQVIVSWFYKELDVRNLIRNAGENRRSSLDSVHGIKVKFDYKYSEGPYQPHSYIKYEL